MIDSIFASYADLYQSILSDFYPSKGSTGFAERNLSVNWSKAAEIVCGRENLISWFEYQFSDTNNKHIDALVWDRSDGNLYLIESKRFSEPKEKTEEVGDDIVRLLDLYEEIVCEKRMDLSKVKKCYGVILADVWPKKGKRSSRKKIILESFEKCSFLAENICNFSESAKQTLKEYPFPELKYYNKAFDDVSDVERYALISLSWRIA